MKKIIGIATSVLLLSAGGAYYYGVQQFNQNAQIIVATIEKAKPGLNFESIEVDKYRFQIRFKNLKIDTHPYHDFITKLGAINSDNKVEFNPEPILLSIDDTFSLSYNPFTKTAHLTPLNHEATGQFSQGNMVKNWKIMSSGNASIQIGFADHPNLIAPKIKDILTPIRSVSIHSSKYEMIDAQTSKPIISVDSSLINVAINLPENDREDAFINYSSDINNKIVEKELYNFCGNIFANIFIGEMREQIDLMFKMIPNQTSKVTEKTDLNLKIMMSDLEKIIDGKFNIKKDMPVISGTLNNDHISNMNKTTLDSSFSLDPKKFTLKVNLTGKCEKEFRQYFATYLANQLTLGTKLDEKAMQNQSSVSPLSAMPSLDEETLIDITPDFASLGNIHLSLNMNGDIKLNEYETNLVMGTDQYNLNAKANYLKETGGKIEAELSNSDQLMGDLKSYFDRIFSHKEIKDSMPADAQEELMANLLIVKTTFETLGRKEIKDGNTVLKMEFPLPGTDVSQGQ